ncbi:uncharacterized protein B0I36DRAFT_354846 [Microdochium trichocladiopsis]|uniref:Uncharacterized protein n=1 Tax=Microdochium trichocladiopsis TaxID=1682393 RepID=A0A9P8XY42_9PEZI|nr:uncharacterized protein B0I36DRAFT_354846 [Microdochium trichocladiopsis]KAH7018583.1 hypothetical protein B0I36DRAFT_354846 [Microdochium trichocladiopsis]
MTVCREWPAASGGQMAQTASLFIDESPALVLAQTLAGGSHAAPWRPGEPSPGSPPSKTSSACAVPAMRHHDNHQAGGLSTAGYRKKLYIPRNSRLGGSFAHNLTGNAACARDHLTPSDVIIPVLKTLEGRSSVKPLLLPPYPPISPDVSVPSFLVSIHSRMCIPSSERLGRAIRPSNACSDLIYASRSVGPWRSCPHELVLPHPKIRFPILCLPALPSWLKGLISRHAFRLFNQGLAPAWAWKAAPAYAEVQVVSDDVASRAALLAGLLYISMSKADFIPIYRLALSAFVIQSVAGSRSNKQRFRAITPASQSSPQAAGWTQNTLFPDLRNNQGANKDTGILVNSLQAESSNEPGPGYQRPTISASRSLFNMLQEFPAASSCAVLVVNCCCCGEQL